MRLRAHSALISGFVIAAMTIAAPLARAAEYPTRTIKLVVPYAAGGPTDVLGRLVADYLGRDLKQTAIVENKPGAQGAIAAEMVARAEPDGYTLFVTAASIFVLNPLMYKKLSYDPVKDFRMLALVTDLPVVMEVHPSVPAKTVAEFVAYAKANPGKLAYGHGSSGSLVSAALLGQMAGLDTVSVPYKGIPPALTDLLGGQLQFAFADVGNAVSQMNGGRLKGLGITTSRRAGKANQVPPIADTVKDYAVSAWFGLMAPANLPPEAAAKINAAFATVMAKPEVREKIQNAGIDVDVQDSAQLAKTIDAEIKKWAGWVKAANITPE
jgi:tripartite-type tricarboxylate transporter receptor subunit TctC